MKKASKKPLPRRPLLGEEYKDRDTRNSTRIVKVVETDAVGRRAKVYNISEPGNERKVSWISWLGLETRFTLQTQAGDMCPPKKGSKK